MAVKYYKFNNGKRLKVGTMFGIGKNYAAHAKEMGGGVPEEPIIFLKPSTSYVANNGAVILPPISQNVHHEVELVVVIGKDCRNIKKNQAWDYVAGVAVGIDVTLRDVQHKAKEKGEPWAVSKGFFTSAPISGVIPIEDLKSKFFDIELFINGVLKQKASTKTMERSVPELIEYISKVFTLSKGDCIFTGTPEGVGKIVKGDKLIAKLLGYTQLNINVI
jgi:2-keto-4-pentenoate hydratase/2-oxohepta-3-ene-1,7-dioic acid hydratase in catechol pathway